MAKHAIPSKLDKKICKRYYTNKLILFFNPMMLYKQYNLLFKVTLIILSGSLTGCAEKAVRPLPVIIERGSFKTHIDPEITLLDKPKKDYENRSSASLISMNGNAHVFVLNSQNQLMHLEIFENNFIKTESFDVISNGSKIFLDAVEYPPGTIRVLLNDKQYIRSSTDSNWKVLEGNRCSRFLTIDDELLCAFVTRGNRISAQKKRKDVTAGLFFILPVFWWKNVDVAKLVLAQETPNGWISRAVLDKDTDWDANNGFLMESDSDGRIHFLYYTSKGGSWFFIGGGPGGFGGVGGATTLPELKYAVLSVGRLAIQNNSENNDHDPGQKTISEEYININGTTLNLEKYFIQRKMYNISLNPDEFRVNKLNGVLEGLLNMTTLNYFNNYDVILDLTINQGQWPPISEIIKASDFIPQNHHWNRILVTNFIRDSNGNTHVLFKGVKTGFFKSHFFIAYSLNKNDRWSEPIILGTLDYGQVPLLTLGQNGNLFVSWIDEEPKLIGCWIKPDIENIP